MKFLKLPVNGLLWLLKHPKVLVGTGVFFLALLIWFAGPFIGLESHEVRLVLIVGVLFIWIIFLLIDQYLAARNAGQLEKSLQKQAEEQVISARPDRKENVEALKSGFEKGILSLKQSRLSKGNRGSAALYALPWYMFIGPPASGKSTALLHSGLQFPSLGSDGKGIQGVGGTRNCDWWFTNEAVLLDTAGRYVTEQEDREEWHGFLSLLKKHRKKKPINGVLATISVADLLQYSDEELESHARNMRARIDELIQQLGIVFPVYLLFTKCDLIQGFVEFFEDFNKTERDQLWGATFPKSFPAGETPQGRFDSEFKKLSQALQCRRTERLLSARGSNKIRDIYGFPLQFASGKAKYARFVELLFQPNPYKENPLFRGFYFTSGTQEGTPIDRIMGAVSRASGLSEKISESFEVQKEPKSYFIKNLFTDVVFPDQTLAGSSSAMARQRGYFRIGIFATAVVLVLLFSIGLFISYAGNRYLMSALDSSSQKAMKIEARDDRQFESNVLVLEKVRGRVAQLRDYDQEGAPLRLRLGLYRGSTLYPTARIVYFSQFSPLFLSPTKSAIELELGNFVLNSKTLPPGKDTDYYYSLLKAYLMMSDPSHRDPVFLDKVLRKLWENYLAGRYGEKHIPKDFQEAVFQQVSFYGSQTSQEDAPLIVPDQRLVSDAQRVLQEMPLVDRIYGRIRREASEGVPSVTLETLLQGKGGAILESTYAVPGIFTEKGWKTAFKETMEKDLADKGQEGWVLGMPEYNREEMAAEVEKRYFNDYVVQWRKFIEATRLKPVEKPSEIARKIDDVTQEGSPLNTFFLEVDRQTDLAGSNRTSGGITGIFQKSKKEDRRDAQGINPDRAAQVSSSFRSLHEFIFPAGDSKKESGLHLYFAELKKVREALPAIDQTDGKAVVLTLNGNGSNELGLGIKNVDKLTQQFDPGLKEAVSPLLFQPLKWEFSVLMDKSASDLTNRWKTEVYESCRRGIDGRYPFKQGGEEAVMNDVADFFQPQNGQIWKFYNKDLQMFIDEGTGQWGVKRWIDVGLPASPEFLENLHHANLISESLFPKRTPTPQISFDLYPYPTPGASEILIQVDGKTLRYRNEPQEWHEITWPGPAEPFGGSLQVVSSGIRQSRQYGGRWSLFKMLDDAKISSLNPTRNQAEWMVKVQETKTVKVRFDFRAQGNKNPFTPGLFSEFHCVASLK